MRLWFKLRNWAQFPDPFSGEVPDFESPVEFTHRPAAGPEIKIVALLGSARDRELLASRAADQNWTLFCALTCGEAWALLNQHKAHIFLCDRDFPGAEWRGVMQMISAAPHPVYSILVSRVADDYLWSEVIRYGGYDVLPAPLGEEKLLRAIGLAWSYWNSSMRMPPMLIKHYL